MPEEMVVNYCERHGSITVRDAFALGINSPTKVLSNIRKSPKFEITSEWETASNRYGILTRFKRYYIKRLEHE